MRTQDAARALTQEGSILGTLQYMAPEQLEGKEVDARADIFAFGAVVYEMVTGKQAFPGTSQASLIAAIMRAQPQSISELESMTPPTLAHVVQRCLAKDPDDRWQSARDVRAALQFAAESGAAPRRTDVASPMTDRRGWILNGVLSIALIASLVANVGLFSSARPVPAPTETRFQIDAPLIPNVLSIALSRDGRQIAYVGESESGPSIWVRRLNSVEARVLPGTEGTSGASYPFWSPDGRFIAFRVGRELKKVEVTSGRVETVTADIGVFRRGAWGPDGTTILFGTDVIRAVPSAGGEAVAVTQLDQSLGEIAHSGPWFLPGGRHFLYKTTSTDPRNRAIYIGSLDPGEARRRLLEASRAVYVEPGFIIFAREQTLYARPFDADRLEFTGEAVQIIESVSYNETLDSTAFEASDEGTLIFRGVDVEALRKVPLVWLDRSGRATTPLGLSLEPGASKLSPDGTRIAFTEGDPPDVWIFDIDRRSRARLTADPDTDHAPIWSPDGLSIAFDSHRGGTRAIYEKPANGAVPEKLLFEAGPNHVQVTDWSRDGRFIIFERDSCVGCHYDLWVLPTSGDRQPFPYLSDGFDTRSATLSPDGRWMAYATNESGVSQVVVQPFPDPSGGKWQLSTEGGRDPRWGRNGEELYFRDSAGWIARAEIATDPAFKVGKSVRVFETAGVTQWDVTRDGQRLLTTTPAPPESVPPPLGVASSPITVVLNWTALIENLRSGSGLAGSR